MEHLLGITGLAFVGLVTLYLALRHPAVRIVLLVAFTLRAGAALFHFYVAPLPDGTSDAVSFERTAWEWASGGVPGVLEHFRGPHSYFISFIIGIVYAVTDRSLLLAQSLSVLCGMGSVFLSWKLTREIWGKRAALKAAWVTALFPTLVLYSALTLREAYIVFFLLLGLLYASRWARDKRLWYAFWAMAAFTGATFFHGAMFVAVVVFTVIILVQESIKCLILLSRFRLSLISFALLFSIILLISGFVLTDQSLPKIGNISRMTDFERIADASSKAMRGPAAYPQGIIPRESSDLVVTLPFQVSNFLFSPFPWDVKSPVHFIGLLDGMLYLTIFFLIFRNIRNIWTNPSSRVVLLIILPLVLTFALGTGNFGTGIRHRAKLAVAFIALAGPAISDFKVFARLGFRFLQIKTVPSPQQAGVCNPQ